jgi:multidrug efflux pump
MRALISTFFKNDKAILLTLFSFFLFGILNYINLPKEENPDVQIPMFYIPMVLRGISPLDSERLLVKPLEKKFRSIEGIDEVIASAYEGGASITLKFDSKTNMKEVINEVRAKVQEAMPLMPKNLENVVVHEINISDFPVLNVILKGDVSERDFVFISKKLRDKIEVIPEILSVQISGVRQEVVEINIKPSDLEIYNLNISEIEQSIRLNNFLTQAGSIKTPGAEFSLKVSGMFENVDQIRNMVIKTSKNGSSILRLKDIATVRETFKDYETIARVNGEKAVVLEVSKRAGKNIIETIEAVKKTIDEEKKNLPSQIEIIYSQDNSKKIKDMLKELISTIIIAILIVFLVISFELGIRSAFLVGISIPGSFFIGITIISLMNLTVNVVVLFSLILAIGMLVDAAIVIVEYADRKMISGLSPKEAYIVSASEMFWPCVAASMTTKIVFLPLLFWPGITGKFMRYMPLTLLSTLIGSLFMAIMFIPILGWYFGKPKKLNFEQIKEIESIENGETKNLHGVLKKYFNLLNFALKRPGRTILLIFSILILIGAMFGIFGKGVEFFPKIEPENSILDIHSRGNFSISEKDKILKEIEDLILQKFSKEVKVFYTKIGIVDRKIIGTDMIGRIFLEFEDWQKRRKAAEILDEIRLLIDREVSGIILRVNDQKKGPSEGKDIELELVGKNDQMLLKATDSVLSYMSKIGGFVDIEDSKPLPMIDFELVIDREKAAQDGVYASSLNKLIPLLTEGVLVGKYQSEKYDEEIDINIRFYEEFRNLSQIKNLRINGSRGMVPVSNFAKFVPKQKLSSIEHSNGLKVKKIKANVSKGSIANNLLLEILKMQKKDFDWPEEIELMVKGNTKDMKETGRFLGFAFGGALLGMITTLVIQFNSIFLAFLVLSAVIFSTFGVFIALMIKGEPFGIVMCGVAIITLTGIVVNNNILLIDAYLKLKEAGVNAYDSVVRAAISRLRPILLTSITTAIGLLPMVFSLGINLLDFEFSIGAPSSQWWVQLSTAIVGGVLFATILTLFFTPSVLVLANKISEKYKK